MVDTLLFADEKTSRSRFSINADNVLVDNGSFTEAGLLENIAQTAAAGEGFRALKESRPVRVGYIGAIKNFIVARLPKPGDTIITEIIIREQVFNVSVIEGKSWCGEQLLASCEMKLFLENPS